MRGNGNKYHGITVWMEFDYTGTSYTVAMEIGKSAREMSCTCGCWMC